MRQSEQFDDADKGEESVIYNEIDNIDLQSRQSAFNLDAVEKNQNNVTEMKIHNFENLMTDEGKQIPNTEKKMTLNATSPIVNEYEGVTRPTARSSFKSTKNLFAPKKDQKGITPRRSRIPNQSEDSLVKIKITQMHQILIPPTFCPKLDLIKSFYWHKQKNDKNKNFLKMIMANKDLSEYFLMILNQTEQVLTSCILNFIDQ